METIIDEDEYIGEPEHGIEVAYKLKNRTIFCTPNEMYYMKKLAKVYKRYIRAHPDSIYDAEEVWNHIMEHLPFKKKYLTKNISNTFKTHMDWF